MTLLTADKQTLVQAIHDIVAEMPLGQTAQLYEFALFLQTRPHAWAMPIEGEDDVEADEAIWAAQFAETDEDKLAALVTAVEAEIQEGQVWPMFDEHGEFIERV